MKNIKPSAKNALIYFWSGTGNSYRVSTWLGKFAQQSGLGAEVLQIDQNQATKKIQDETESIVGIVFPTHAFTAPWHVLKSVWNLPSGHSTPAFCVATRAGLKFGPVFVPGISGTGTFIIALILMLKGYRVNGTMSVDMPSNWFSLHPPQSRKRQEAIIGRAEQKVNRFMQRILANRRVWLTFNNLYEITWGILLSLISLAYLLMGRFFLAKLFFANENCDGCAVCASYCSVGGIEMWGKKNPRPFWKYNCESCMRCATICPRHAIEAGQSWGVILYFITAVPISAYLFSLLARYVPGIGSLQRHWIGEVLDVVYYYPALFISYYVFHALLRIPRVNWLFTHTTMTHFWGRYREPNVKIKDFAVRKKVPGKLRKPSVAQAKAPSSIS